MIAPSILNINNLNLEKDIQTTVNAGINRFHIDIMDGHFVPNLSFGPQLVSDFKKAFPSIEAEIHLMSNNPDDLVPAFTKAGAQIMLLHYEAMTEEKLNYWLDYLNENQVKAGVVLNPDTPVSVLSKFISKIDQILLMTVFPGFGGQKFIPDSLSRIKEASNLVNGKVPIEVDGGINGQTAKKAKDAGAEIFVAGSYLFCQNSVEQQIAELKGILE
ncbi:Ribulose-phosphate 3-epimerase [Lactobacillus kullabergensis]|uniref:Ribulose-phosphate 3-epimerase n=1 Tax=Lactobacillus kullabergensis TaxID=1218493 RepID=A0A0F4LC38_9LACO|nr:ribulose-phosphate 3-epimerase [Lactobacillus kullabergensis]KJY55106.1 Ribulose-phosphate 3-epimerase [Lactobacillus kullabergensis]